MICEKQAKSFAEKKKNYKELFYQFKGFLLHSEIFSLFHLRMCIEYKNLQIVLCYTFIMCLHFFDYLTYDNLEVP